MSKKTTGPAAAPDGGALPIDPSTDEFAGLGGSYIVDSATGKRRLVERTASGSDHTRDYSPAGEPAQSNPTTEA